MLDKVVREIRGNGNPAKCIQSNAALPLPLPAASRSPVNATATASPVKLLGGNSTVGDERGRIEVQAQLLPDWALREKAQRTQVALAAGIAARLPDGGSRLRLWLDASLGEISNRRRDTHAAPHPQGGDGDGDGEAPVPDIVVCEICGSGSIPHLIAKCALCNAYEHRYCLRVVVYSIPHQWHCYECQEKDNGDPKCSQELLLMSQEQSYMKVTGNKKNLTEMKITANVPLNGPHMEEVQVETDPTQLQSILPTEVPMVMWEQSPMDDCVNQKNISRMKSTANILLEDPHVEAAEAEEARDAGRKKQSSFNLSEKRKYCDEHTNSKGNKDEEEFKEPNITMHAVTVSDFSMTNEALSNLMQEFRRWRPRITGYQKGHRTEKVKTAAGARGR